MPLRDNFCSKFPNWATLYCIISLSNFLHLHTASTPPPLRSTSNPPPLSSTTNPPPLSSTTNRLPSAGAFWSISLERSRCSCFRRSCVVDELSFDKYLEVVAARASNVVFRRYFFIERKFAESHRAHSCNFGPRTALSRSTLKSIRNRVVRVVRYLSDFHTVNVDSNSPPRLPRRHYRNIFSDPETKPVPSSTPHFVFN
jgi:hypothetical protein